MRLQRLIVIRGNFCCRGQGEECLDICFYKRSIPPGLLGIRIAYIYTNVQTLRDWCWIFCRDAAIAGRIFINTNFMRLKRLIVTGGNFCCRGESCNIYDPSYIFNRT
jgi:hypothetical protein